MMTITEQMTAINNAIDAFLLEASAKNRSAAYQQNFLEQCLVFLPVLLPLTDEQTLSITRLINDARI